MIEVSNLCKSFGSYKVLDSLNLHIKKSSIYGLVGPNGAGKTTLIKHLTGVYRQDKGTVKISDQTVFNNPDIKSKMLFIPDDLYFFSQYTIDEMAEFYKSIYPSWNQVRYEKLKQVFPIDVKRKITRLSKGMQKQVAFWLGICIMPEMIILDEPVDGLDPIMRKKVWNLILQDVAERESTVLISSHNLRELEDVCDHVGILHNGKIVIEKELDDMKSNIHKLQVAFPENITEDIWEDIEILNKTRAGSVYLLIVRGKKESILAKLKRYDPLILDILSLTFEEIFIYELGGMGYEIENILI